MEHTSPATLLLGGSAKGPIRQLAAMSNRHGLIAGATGTGKTVTLQLMAEQFSALGVPVFLADIKGDLAGLSQPGRTHPKVQERIDRIGIPDWRPAANPVVFWDVFGELGHPFRTTVSEMGPMLLGRLLGLNDVQGGILTLAFRLADDEGLLLLDLKDLRALLTHVGERAAELRTTYGNVSPASLGAIQRRLLELEEQGGAALFGEPAVSLEDLMQTDANGRGVVNVLAAEALFQSPRLYATLLLWLLAELFENLAEVGDADRPRLVFFFDEAHLLFDSAPPVLLEKIEQVVRLIRSKGVGVYFITQSPKDVPTDVLGQLGHRVQHALRAFTAEDAEALRKTARTFRSNPVLDIETTLTELGVGEALVQVLDEQGMPTPVERALIAPPRSRIGPVSLEERAGVRASSPFAGHFEAAVDRESAHERLSARANAPLAQLGGLLGGPVSSKGAGSGGLVGSLAGHLVKTAGKAVVREASNRLARQLVRGLFGAAMAWPVAPARPAPAGRGQTPKPHLGSGVDRP